MAKIVGNPGSYLGDRSLWAEAVRDVRPLPGRLAPAVAAAVAAAPSLRLCPPQTAAFVPDRDATPLERFVGIDRASAERLKRGQHPIEARLDLHGLTQSEAHHALIEFVEGSYQSGRRCLLVITGRGLGADGPGVLKSLVPRWLGETGLRRRILAVAAAQPRHGGAGALYLLLRRQR